MEYGTLERMKLLCQHALFFVPALVGLSNGYNGCIEVINLAYYLTLRKRNYKRRDVEEEITHYNFSNRA